MEILRDVQNYQENLKTQFQRNAILYSGQTNDFKVGDSVWVFSSKKVPNKPGKVTMYG